MAEAAAAQVQPTRGIRVRTQPAPGPVKPWHQQKGDNELWYARFLRYVALGPTRSVSLVATGERNHYPVPAHWPSQAKQRSWKTRAAAFDEAAKADPSVIGEFNNLLTAFASSAPPEEKLRIEAALVKGGYQAPPPEEDETDFDGTPLKNVVR